MQKAQVLKKVSPRDDVLIKELITSGEVLCTYHGYRKYNFWQFEIESCVWCHACRQKARRVIAIFRNRLR